MTINVRLFGDLKGIAPELDKSGTIGLMVVDEELDTIQELLDHLGLELEQTSHLFLNGDYSGPGRPVGDGDTVSVFPRGMALLYKWYFHKEE